MKKPVRLLAGLAALALVLGPAPAQAAPETMTMAIWSNYLPEDVIHDFEKAAGCKVEIPWYYGGNDELLAKLQGKDTGFDVVVPSDVILPALIGQGLLEPLDRAALSNAGPHRSRRSRSARPTRTASGACPTRGARSASRGAPTR